MRRPVVSFCLFALASGCLFTGCLDAWKVGGPWACSSDQTCPGEYTCDDGVCCKPGSTPECPTLPNPNGSCPTGTAATWYQDLDGDGFGNDRVAKRLCHQPLVGSWTMTAGDCDDTSAAIYLGGPELCDGLDNNCNGIIDDGLTPQTDYYLDSDGDGYGQTSVTVKACAAPPGYVLKNGDCAPFDPSKFPGAQELCNGLDDNCDGLADSSYAPTVFADVDTADHPFPCLTTTPGQCAAGTFQCLGLRDGGVQRACRSTLAAGREVCDGVDNDCDGLVDEQPDCGGPPTLHDAQGATYAALKLNTGAAITQRCQKHEAGTPETATAGGVWSGSGAGYHLWSVEAPAGQFWDLSNPNATLALTFAATGTTPNATRGLWGDPMNGDAVNPVVYLCGATDTELMRYRLVSAMNGFKLNDPGFDRKLQLKAVGSDWLVGLGSGFDTTRVKRVEVLMYDYADTFTVTFSPDAGFSR